MLNHNQFNYYISNAPSSGTSSIEATENNEYGIFQVFGDATISISNGESSEMILEKSFNKIQGSSFQSNKEAANQSLKKMSEKITADFLPEIIELIKN